MGIGITAIFQKQWVQHERLSYPVAQVVIDLTQGFDRRVGGPPFLKSKAFWAGFAIAAVPILWNIISYWILGFPKIEIFWRDCWVGALGIVDFARAFETGLATGDFSARGRSDV